MRHRSGQRRGDDLGAARVAVRRVLTALEEQLTAGEYAELAGLIFTGTNTIARLLRTRRALAGQSADGIAGAIATALDELATEWNVEL